MFQPMAFMLRWRSNNMKKSKLILSILSLLALASCATESNSQSSSFEGEYTIFDAANFVKPDANITSIKVLNVPKDPIEIGKFKDANIILQVNYINDQTELYTIDEDFFEGDSIDLISTVGKKQVTILFKRNRVSFEFEMVSAKTPVYYTVQFKNYYGDVVYTDVVPYLKDATYKGYTLPDKIEGNYIYQYSGKWSKDITKVHQNLVVEPIFEKKHIILRHENIDLYPSMPYLGKGSKYVFYMGRMYNFPLAYSSTYTHNDSSGQKMSFTYDDVYSSLSTLFMPVFKEAIYKGYYYETQPSSNINIIGEDKFYFNESSFNVTETDDGDFVSSSNSSGPSFAGRIDIDDFKGYQYPLDGSYSTFTPLQTTKQELMALYGDKTFYDYIYPNDSYGYYRMVLTCQADCYLLIDAVKTSADDYKVNEVKFGIFPNASTTKLLKEHSDSEDFSDEYHLPIQINTWSLYSSLKKAI